MKRLRKKTGSISIRASIYIQILILLIAIITGMVSVMRSLTLTRLKSKETELQLSNTRIMLSELDNYMMTLMTKTDSLFVSTQFGELIESAPRSLSDQTVITSQLRTMMDTTVFNLRYPEVSLTNYASSVYPCLFVRNQQVYLDDEFIRNFSEIEREPYIEELLTQRRMFSWNRGYSRQTGSYIAFNRRILNNTTMEDIAILQVRIPISRIQVILDSVQTDYQIACFYADNDGNPIYSSVKSDMRSLPSVPEDNTCVILRPEGSDAECMVSCTRSDLNGYRLYCVSSMQPVQNSISFVTPIFLLSGIAAILAGSVSLFFLTGRLMRGLNALVGKIHDASAAADSYEHMPSITGSREIEALDSAYGDMVRTINELHDKQTRSAETLNQVQMELLQEQFNPHLLYNTLSMVRYLEDPSGESRICAVLDNLIRFYKRVLNRGQIITRISDEVDMIRSYLAVVREVYALELDVRIDIGEDVRGCCAVKMFLQPIVENAIKHGIQQSGSGELAITGVREEGMLHFSVTDNGPGMEYDRLEQIRGMINSIDNGSSQSYGYLSIAKRLRLFFGDDYRMEIESEPGEGTRVDLFIPAIHEDQISETLKTSII